MSKRFWILSASILASSMAFIDGSALNVAIPSIQKAFNANGSEILWILNSYLLMLAAFILPGGALGDKLGRKKVFITGIAIFLLASVGCGLSPNSQFLIVARFIQGLGGAFMIPGSLSLINASVEPQERGKAIGIWSSVTTLVTVGGPILGGYFADIGFWRGVFLINLPIGIVALLILTHNVPESRNESDNTPIDYLGAFLLALGLGALSYGILRIPDLGFQHIRTSGSIVAGLGMITSFLIHEANSKSPMLPLKLFRSTSFTGSNLLTLFLYGALSGGLFFLSLNLIQIQGYSQTLAGFAGLPFVLLLALLSPRMGSLIGRFSPRLFLTIGPSIVTVAFYLLSLPGQTQGPADYWTAFFPGMLVFGLGMAMTVTPLTTTVLTSAGKQYSGTASGINNAISRIAGVLAIAVLGAFALWQFQHQLLQATAPFALSEEARHSLQLESKKLGETLPPKHLSPILYQHIESAIHHAFIQTYKMMMLLCAGFAGISAVLGFLFIKSIEES